MISKIDRLFGSRTRVALLSKLLMNSDKTFHIRELSNDLGIPYSMLYKEEKNLVSLGILYEEKRGKLTLVYVNKDLPYLAELRGLISRTAGLADVLRVRLAKFEKIRYALVYGSLASGKESQSSDVDLLIIGDIDEERILKAVNQCEAALGREINYILWSESEFRRRVKGKHHLLADIVRNPVIMIIGDSVEFGRAVKK